MYVFFVGGLKIYLSTHFLIILLFFIFFIADAMQINDPFQMMNDENFMMKGMENRLDDFNVDDEDDSDDEIPCLSQDGDAK